ncbi:hypothetical protein JM654_14615 [Microbacterium oxydans]|nr:hypothetical protein [Microbacterium oxydans]
MSLSDYVAAQLTSLVQYRTNAEIVAAARARAAARGSALTRDQVLEARDSARADRDASTIGERRSGARCLGCDRGGDRY